MKKSIDESVFDFLKGLDIDKKRVTMHRHLGTKHSKSLKNLYFFERKLVFYIFERKGKAF